MRVISPILRVKPGRSDTKFVIIILVHKLHLKGPPYLFKELRWFVLLLLGYLLQTVIFGLENFLHEIIYFGFYGGLVHSNAVIIYFRVSNQNLNLYKKCMKFFWKNFHKKVFLIFWVCVHSIKCIIPCFFIHPEYHIFL